jgi:hypothetical protein
MGMEWLWLSPHHLELLENYPWSFNVFVKRASQGKPIKNRAGHDRTGHDNDNDNDSDMDKDETATTQIDRSTMTQKTKQDALYTTSL